MSQSAHTSQRLLAVIAAMTLPLLACSSGEIRALPESASEVARIYAGECDEGVAASCYALALLYSLGEDAGHGISANEERASALLAKACEGGHEAACGGDALLPPSAVDSAESAEPANGEATNTEGPGAE